MDEIDFLVKFKKLAFQKDHRPRAHRCFDPRKDRQNRPDFSLGACNDAERFRTLEQKHGRGWVSDPYQDPNNNFRGYVAGPVKGADGQMANFSVRSASVAKESLKRKQFMTLSSPLFPPDRFFGNESRTGPL